MPVTTRGMASSGGAQKAAVQPKRKRTALLAARTVPKTYRDVYDMNATNSPLLRLPAEVRNRIWGFVLGGKTIHMACDLDKPGPPVMEHAICQGGPTENAFAANVKAAAENDEKPLWATDEHMHHRFRCMPINDMWGRVDRTKKVTLSISLLQVCRQIHQEAALLPFVDNLFTFWNFWDLEVFLQCLVFAQASAIRRITVGVQNHSTYDCEVPTEAPEHVKSFPRLLRSKLKGLREILIFAKFTENYDGGPPHFAESPEIREAWTASVLQFEHLPIVSVVVAAANYRSAWYDEHAGWYDGLAPAVSNKMLRTWTKEMEEKLMAPAA